MRPVGLTYGQFFGLIGILAFLVLIGWLLS